jgi:putative protease
MTHRDPNQGACTNSCRWKYQAHEAEQTPEGEIRPLASSVQTFEPPAQEDEVQPLYLLQEKSRPGEYMPAYEDEHGTYIMNSKDLRAVQHVQKLIEIGVDSLKIEGRTKSYYYVARTAQVYREAIDDALAGRAFNMKLMDELEGMANRGFTEGFYRRHLPDQYQNYESGNSESTKQLYVADVSGRIDGSSTLVLEIKNRIQRGDSLTLLTPEGNLEFRLDHMRNAKNRESLDCAPGTGWRIELDLPALADLSLTPEALAKGLIVRNL